MAKLNKPLKVWQLFAAGFAVMLFGTYVVGLALGQALGGIFVFAGLFLWIVATVKGIKKLLG